MIFWPKWCSVDCWKSAIINLNKARQLSGADGWLLFQAFLGLPLVALLLRCFGLRRVQARLQQGPAKHLGSDDRRTGLDRARATARLVQVAARHGLFRPTCLPQSLVLWWLLRRQRLTGKLHIGVRPEPNRLEAHAWVEFQGLVLNDSEDVARRFAPFPREIRPWAA
jgi:hypothetical protein